MPPEKVINFLISDEFYAQFLSIVNNFGIKSDENFMKFVEINKFFDGWFRENWSQEESYLKAKEIMTEFSDEEITQVLDFINKNFNKQREALWQSEPEVENLESMDEKERRYLEIMSTLVKFPEKKEEPNENVKEEEKIRGEEIVPKFETETQKFIQEEPPLEVEISSASESNISETSNVEMNTSEVDVSDTTTSEPEKTTPEDETTIIESEKNPTEESVPILTTNFETQLEKQEESTSTSEENIDNIIISYKKGEEKKPEDEEKFLDLSSL